LKYEILYVPIASVDVNRTTILQLLIIVIIYMQNMPPNYS